VICLGRITSSLAVPATVLTVLVTVPAFAQEAAPTATQRDGVRLVADAGADATYTQPILSVVAVAKETMDRTFRGLHEEPITVYVHPAHGWFENTVTDRRSAIHISLGAKGIGEYFRADASPVSILCQAVAELHNPKRLPGFDRYVTHRYLVPAVVAELGPDAVPSSNARPVAEDGAAMLELMTDGAYTPMHPDFAAVAVWLAIEERLKLEGLTALLAGIPADAQDPFDALRQAAIAKAPALAAAFDAYDEATRPDLQEDGSWLIASFEPDEIVSHVSSHPLAALHDPLVLVPSAEFQVSQTDEWATDGTQSLKLYAEQPRDYASVSFGGPDWKYRDWTKFAAFEMDLMVVADQPQDLNVWLHDDPGYGHGMVILFHQIIQPGVPCHVACPLNATSLRGEKSYHGYYFGTGFRASEVASLLVMLRNPTGPVTLYLDNIRLTKQLPAGLQRRPGIVSDFEEADLALWKGLSADTDHVTEGLSAGRWERPDVVHTVAFDVAMDWSDYQYLEFDCCSEAATNDRFILMIESMDKAADRPHYWAYMFPVNWTGWRHYKVPFRRLLGIRNPLGWDRVSGIHMYANGWGMQVVPETTLVFDNMRLTKGEARQVPAGLIDDFEEGPWAWWWMDEGSVPAHGGEHCGQFPLHEGWRHAECKGLTTNWSPYKELRLWLYAENLNGEVLVLRADGSGGPFAAEVPLDGEGWREAVLPFARNPGEVGQLSIEIKNLHGDDAGVANRQLNPAAILCLDDITLR
jgi:hypothetical protein